VGDSLQDQLLKAGLVDKSKLSKVKKQKQKQARRERHGDEKVRSLDPRRQKEDAERTARERELNQRRNEARRQREIAAQVTQLVSQHRHPRTGSEDDRPFYFENKGKVKRIYVSPKTQGLITSGALIIVNHNGVFDLVPPPIAEKIRQRNPSLVIDLPEQQPVDDDDLYAEYQVPDDLVW
jgi:uncharacterized protein YaiL (DUF2058 family)